MYRQAREHSEQITSSQFFGFASETRISKLIEALNIATKSRPRTLEYLRPYHAVHCINKLCDCQLQP